MFLIKNKDLDFYLHLGWIGILLFICISLSSAALAQEDLMALLESERPQTKRFVSATFKGSRLINGHSVETKRGGELEFIIAHRFGRLNSGAGELFGLDASNIRFGLEYGLADWLNIALGRSSFEKTYDGFIKIKLLRQSEGEGSPISLVAFTSLSINSLKNNNPDIDLAVSDRIFYTYQLLIARKFNNRLSLQLMPTVVHRNLANSELDDNDIYALGMGGRVKLTKRLALNAEYYYQFNPVESIENHNALALGFDIETGGHVFQLHLTNSRAMIEKAFITETNGNFFKGDIHFGFNITRTFTIKQR